MPAKLLVVAGPAAAVMVPAMSASPQEQRLRQVRVEEGRVEAAT